MQIKAKELLVAIAVKNNGNYNGIIKTIHDRELISSEEDCPKTLTNIPMPPLVLFLKDGDRSLLAEASERGVCVLDDRKTPKINEIVGGILDHGCTIAVPNFENGEIMLENEQHFLIVTEYPDGCYDKDNKAQKARVASIAAGLCGRLFVGYGISALDVSHAVSCTINGGGDVYVVPASIDSKDQLNNALIYEGANVALSWGDIVDHEDDEEKSE